MPEEAPIVPGILELLARDVPVVLAVSGGIDSMVLLDAAAEGLRRRRPMRAGGAPVLVATFDHGSGSHATAAADFVRREAQRRGLPVEVGRWSAPVARATEAAWRERRWSFLRSVARRHRALVATAHTLDDHLETVVLRILRGAGARGLAALLAPSTVARPLLHARRADVAQYAASRAVQWLEDPSNALRAHQRNRVRLDLLPALRAADPTIDAALLALSMRAAVLRGQLTSVVRALIEPATESSALQGIAVDRRTIARLSEGRELFWQELAALAGVTLDWRGTRRLAAEGAALRDGGHLPLSGGFWLVAHRGAVSFRKARPSPAPPVDLGLDADTLYGVWRFSRVSDATINEGGGGANPRDPWMAWLPLDRSLTVRAWQAGDRLGPVDGDGTERRERRVKRYLADARIAAVDRPGWPVVVAGDEVLWVPGVRRSRAATARSGRPGVCIRCERLDY